MADNLPNIEGDGGLIREATPVLVVDATGNPTTQSGGSKDAANSSETALGSGGTFTGDWVTNSDEHIAFNVATDQDGELFLEFSPDGGTTVTLSKRYDINGGESRFDALVKMPARSHRIRYVNGATAQTSFVLLTAAGNSLYPFATSDRDKPVFFAYSASAISSETFAIIVDISDTPNWPHSENGSIDLYSTFIFVDKPSNTVGASQLGVITRIDGTSADISYIQGISFNNSSDRQIVRDRVLSNPIRLTQTAGNLNAVTTLFKSLAVTAVNTGITLPSSEGQVTPAVGDLIARFDYTSGGAFSASISGQYAGNART